MQNVRDAVLELVSNLVVANSAFTHTCLQLLVHSFLPPPGPPVPDLDSGAWSPPEGAVDVQLAVLSTLEKVRASYRVASASPRLAVVESPFNLLLSSLSTSF